ncbi:hypothetical protein ACTXMV_11115, partial [Psychrobacter celer]|uniref:hypothetical protein n=1 Tax=Psychrobacter celer TaxID=306572 RepID=UPI003FD03144
LLSQAAIILKTITGYSWFTLKTIQCSWYEFCAASVSVDTASKEKLYQLPVHMSVSILSRTDYKQQLDKQ